MTTTDDATAPPALMRLVLGGWTAQAIRTMVTLGIADGLANGPRRLDDLAAASAVDGDALARLATLLAAVGLCEYDDDAATLALTPLGELLRSDVPGSLAPFTRLMTAPWLSRVWDELAEAIRTGRSVFATVHGAQIWDFLAANPELAADFDAAMTGGAEQRAHAILETCDLASVATAYDIGGGQGQLLATVLAANPSMRGVVVDRAEVVAGAAPILASAGVADRCAVAVADFFEAVPSGADVYILAQIIHDWPDTDAAVILRVCAAAMAQGTCLLIVDQVLPNDHSPNLMAAVTDVNMLVLVGGRERTPARHRAMLEAAGFDDVATRRSRGPWTVIEAIRS